MLQEIVLQPGRGEATAPGAGKRGDKRLHEGRGENPQGPWCLVLSGRQAGEWSSRAVGPQGALPPAPFCVCKGSGCVTTMPCLSPPLDMGKSSHVSPAEPKPTGASPHTVPWALPAALPTSPLPASGRPELLVTAKSHGQRDPRLQRARSCDRRAVSGRPCARQCSEVRAGRQRRAPSCAAQKSPWNQHVY